MNEKVKIQNTSDVAKAVLGGKFITQNAYIRKEGMSKTDPSIFLEKLEKNTTHKSLARLIKIKREGKITKLFSGM